MEISPAFVLVALAFLVTLWIPYCLSETMNLTQEEYEQFKDEMEDIEMEAVDGYDPDDPTAGMGTINMAAMKAGECPVIKCHPLKKPKPCPEAKPVKVVINWQGLECDGCPSKWDPDSCNQKSGSDNINKQKPKVMEKKEL